jgi:cytidine deaminase
MSAGDRFQPLVAAALRAREAAYAPYSHFQVGAALQAEDGRVFTGCNVENAAYSPCICAERAAVAKAVEAGARRFTAVVVATAISPPATPCGVCRQVLREFVEDLDVICVNPAGERRAFRLAALLPEGFSGADLQRLVR